MFKLKTTGMDDVIRSLDRLAKNAEALGNTRSVPVSELLTPEFVSKHTRFATASDRFDASGFKIESSEDFAAIPDGEWDVFIRSISSFPDWETMLNSAGKEWVEKKLFV